mmetsp:Transcript_23846/g.94572  ORF Transcript_23846/g.94572 Transcript_23846/m.94572 type:complete len:208 (+) Transcript_23846:1036-1659(+)
MSRPAALASSTPASDSGQSYHPVNSPRSFHVDSPCRRRTSSMFLFGCVSSSSGPTARSGATLSVPRRGVALAPKGVVVAVVVEKTAPFTFPPTQRPPSSDILSTQLLLLGRSVDPPFVVMVVVVHLGVGQQPKTPRVLRREYPPSDVNRLPRLSPPARRDFTLLSCSRPCPCAALAPPRLLYALPSSSFRGAASERTKRRPHSPNPN